MRLILIRHTESIGNQKKVYAGITDYELTENGHKQIGKVLNQFSNLLSTPLTYSLYSSPLQRCIILADQLEKVLLTSKCIDHRLSETNFGVFEDKTYEQVCNEYPDEVKGWNEDIIHYQIPNGESLRICSERVKEFCKELISKNEDAVIVSHGGIIKLMLLEFLHLDLVHFWKFFTNNGCVIELEYNDGFGYIKNMIQLT